MRIGIEAQRLFRPNKHGMDIVALEFIRALQRLSSTHEFYIFVKPDQDDTCLTETTNVHIVRIRAGNYALWEQVFLPYYVRKYRLDVLHCTANTAPLFLKVPLLLTLHDVIFLEKSSQPNTRTLYQRLGVLYRRWVVPRVVERCQKIITVSGYEKKHILERLSLRADQVEVVYNGVSERFFEKPSAVELRAARKRHQLPERYLFFFGNTDPKKNMVNVVKAFGLLAPEMPDLYLVVADTSTRTMKRLLEKIGQERLMERIVVTNYLSADQLPAVYAQATVFLYPSLRESFGLPLLESMACGIPVVTSSVSALPEVAGQAAFYTNPTDPASIKETLKRALLATQERQMNIAAGYRQAALFTWENTARTTLRLYEEVAG
ncbi:glycosyltransferase family 1 protein [Rhabdobacter roseus]|uniref:Glycosyltransferase involved in cell wall biosynthesis n=1 Tax=Rhabdobacter roseus TaxID=1655419 RepID=A0A840TTP1_9BACT|nr:glycosyltransferase family 1 protein [Rhabdobacter roseus]MBB5287321.1 glycosyltransferase involved in cell wall biosynthesis [Rhabdobacter roseus]